MALADYRLCDICGCKTFYDAGLNYDYDATTGGIKLERVGAMKVICEECAKLYDVHVVKKETPHD